GSLANPAKWFPKPPGLPHRRRKPLFQVITNKFVLIIKGISKSKICSGVVLIGHTSIGIVVVGAGRSSLTCKPTKDGIIVAQWTLIEFGMRIQNIGIYIHILIDIV